MIFEDGKSWANYYPSVDKNDPYSSPEVRFAERLADLYEEAVEAGKQCNQADILKMMQDADTEGIDNKGFMNVCYYLPRIWKYGKQFSEDIKKV